ncbi:MAG TPA: exodeoxyribonuclease VII small subunit [Campylobacter avium]|uniref:exodeoxyribonuclease VII small subunit n=1 Tax=Campylobacter avium TaxID=522485 RepID=UPI001D740A7F|nr:exodeoxyribonuclease VII small subunit [Campylobacter avium]HJE66888.1 exodeoxyribonuclease VII small subunit [Campylobacter avium]
MSFEEHINKVNKALEDLNSEDLSLDEGINLYKKAVVDLKKAREVLDKAQLEIEKIDNE